ncbi:hypothetical protein NW762_002743 [Fusarium torreyae]|uniref:WSC domain-containing protein n=1 Tax=Fusarium torreyae TaxID=1237075 RepID=A0A9W8SBX3_9HYPO|nr:hypothetical protein NW762_002743 [Fusarium torreyae]
MVSFRTIVAGATLALSGITQAHNIELPPCLNPFQPFVYSGCYMDGVEGNLGGALIYRSSQNQYNMTVEKCVSECKGNGFRYAGLKYYGVCYCGSTVGGSQLPENQCTMPCTGNSSQTCGNDNAFSIWQDPTFKTTDLGGVVTAVKGTVLPIAGYKPNGCYTDSSPKGRALTWSMDVDSSSMTPTSCLNACANQGFPLAGMEYGGECYCGNVLANDTTKADVGDCNVPCNGDKTLLCGGPSRLSVYISQDLLSLQPCGWTPSNSASSSASIPLLSSTSTTSATTSTVSIASTSSSAPASSSTTSSAVSSSTTSSAVSSSTTSSVSSSSSTSSVASSSTTTLSTATSTTANVQSTTTANPPKPPTTTTTSTSTSSCSTTSSAPMCTATVVVPSTCEYKCGSWCAPSVPDFQDQTSCQTAYNNCAKNIAACFQNAGWPGALNCFDFSKWCDGVQGYCASTCSRGRNCNKAGCLKSNTPSGGNNVQTTTSVYPCAATSTSSTASVPTTSVAPQPTNICQQPSSNIWGYGPGNPVGGIELPLVGCNDLKSDFSQNPFKLYTNTNSNSCSSYRRTQQSGACADACKTQYNACLGTYVQSCKTLNRRSTNEGDNYFGKRSHAHFHKRALEKSGIEPRFFNLFSGVQWQTAQTKCAIQYADCLYENNNVNAATRCQNFGSGY